MSERNLTVVIPTLNVEKTIRLTLESLLPLKEAGAQIIMVDSFSEDRTLKMAEGYVDQVLQCPKGNMYAAINMGIEAAKTAWVSYLNADDVIYPDIISSTLNSVAAETEMFYGDVDFIDFNGRFLHSYEFPGPEFIVPLAASYICAISPIGTVFKKDLWYKLSGFDTRYRYSADFDFLLRAALFKHRLYKIPHPTVGAFRLHSRQLSQEAGAPGMQENRRIIAELNLQVSMKDRLLYKWRFKSRNFWEFLIRLLRRRRLTSQSGLAGCITPPDYRNNP
ncbi:MAG: glycosyltransferase [Candidatus Riflebacteria bacterium]